MCRFQGDSKVMAWVKIVHGKAVEVRWLVDEEGRNVSKKAKRYLDILKQVWEEVPLQLKAPGCKMENGLT